MLWLPHLTDIAGDFLTLTPQRSILLFSRMSLWRRGSPASASATTTGPWASRTRTRRGPSRGSRWPSRSPGTSCRRQSSSPCWNQGDTDVHSTKLITSLWIQIHSHLSLLFSTKCLSTTTTTTDNNSNNSNKNNNNNTDNNNNNINNTNTYTNTTT